MSSSEDIDLSLEGIDPVTFQIIKHRFIRVTDEAVEALKRVSGSPITNEGHDLMVALYTREGDLLTGGAGFLHHYLGASRATKHIIERFEGDIGEGDVFLLNDSYTAAFHPPDVYIIKPIFFEGELVAFAANFVHVADIGAVDAGGFSPNSTSVFHEGFQTPGLKLIEGGEMRDDVLDTILNMSRDPGMVELDLRSQIAANNVAEDRLQGLMAEYGAETVDAVGEELIRQSELKLRRRLLDLPDGRWEARQYLDSHPEDKLYTIRCALEKSGDSMTFDFAGTDEQSQYGFNCTYTATVGGAFAPLFPMLCWDIHWNDGIVRAVDIEAPSGTLVNAERPAPISIATVATLQSVNALSTLVTSKMVGSSPEYRDRATGVWHGAHGGYIVEVETEDGGMVDVITDTFAGAGGGREFADGVDLGGELPNIVSRWGNVERHEATLPLLYLYRRTVADSGGAGKHRGGLGHEYAVTPMPGDDVESIEAVTFGRGTELPQSFGVFGGYPGTTIDYTVYREGLGRADDYPPDDEAVREAPAYDATWGVHELHEGDVFYSRLPGSGGYGDPLERDPDAVAADVASGAVTPAVAREVHGVPVAPDGSVEGDVEAQRAAIREARLEGVDGFESPVDAATCEPTELRLGEALAVVAAGDDHYVACDRCGTVLSAMDEGWKDAVAVRARPVADAGQYHASDDAFRLREFACPACATLLDTEVAREEDPFLRQRLSL
ncbi:hydantoinase B/oxoprolinase family protein [Haloglomus litoreum]|uniref:hydantoinase B/oxoprolinase family protein n=1 Tax=Haloglomus litoreum TaxID=3034026 RepID=UPI0023E7EEC7|nr:hydantoinase B/oxoprolinase family protein [Haloglomus sp. DT116]